MRVLTWAMFFLMCLGLGYPTLSRYDPRQTGLTERSSGLANLGDRMGRGDCLDRVNHADRGGVVGERASGVAVGICGLCGY